MTNLNLDKLREITSAFISETDFQVIQLEYLDCLKQNNLTDTEETARQFCKEWKEEQEILGTFKEITDGNIRYYSLDGCGEKKTMQEFLNEMDMQSYHWENMCRSYWKIFAEIVNTGEVNKQLLTNILSEATVSHEQIYKLQKAMKNRIAELLGV